MDIITVRCPVDCRTLNYKALLLLPPIVNVYNYYESLRDLLLRLAKAINNRHRFFSNLDYGFYLALLVIRIIILITIIYIARKISEFHNFLLAFRFIER